MRANRSCPHQGTHVGRDTRVQLNGREIVGQRPKPRATGRPRHFRTGIANANRRGRRDHLAPAAKRAQALHRIDLAKEEALLRSVLASDLGEEAEGLQGSKGIAFQKAQLREIELSPFNNGLEAVPKRCRQRDLGMPASLAIVAQMGVCQRPVLVVADAGDGDFLLARITTAAVNGPGDLFLGGWQSAGLLRPSWVRLAKLMVIAESSIAQTAGVLVQADARAARYTLFAWLSTAWTEPATGGAGFR